MKKYKAVLESHYYGCDEEFEFEAPDDATEEEINDIAWETLTSNIEWYWEGVEK